MVRNASRTLKIGVRSPFDPNFDVEIGTFYLEKFRQAYLLHRLFLSTMRELKTGSFKLKYGKPGTTLSKS